MSSPADVYATIITTAMAVMGRKAVLEEERGVTSPLPGTPRTPQPPSSPPAMMPAHEPFKPIEMAPSHVQRTGMSGPPPSSAAQGALLGLDELMSKEPSTLFPTDAELLALADVESGDNPAAMTRESADPVTKFPRTSWGAFQILDSAARGLIPFLRRIPLSATAAAPPPALPSPPWEGKDDRWAPVLQGRSGGIYAAAKLAEFKDWASQRFTAAGDGSLLINPKIAPSETASAREILGGIRLLMPEGLPERALLLRFYWLASRLQGVKNIVTNIALAAGEAKRMETALRARGIGSP